LVRSLIGTSSSAEEPDVRAALSEAVGSEHEAYTFLGHLLAINLDPADRAQAEALEPQTLQAAYLKWLRWLLTKMVADGPLVLVCEDIHWADATSVDAIARLLPLVDELPILLICAGRPDRETPGWRLVTEAQRSLGASMTEIVLSPLTESESRELVSNLLVIESLPVRVRDFILRRAEGNPFFVEEVIRMLIDRGAIIRQGDHWLATKEVENVEIPDTLQGLLLARIDRLPDDAKRTLRVASVIGRQFSVKVLEEVLERSKAS
jgi:predicted ATPase